MAIKAPSTNWTQEERMVVIWAMIQRLSSNTEADVEAAPREPNPSLFTLAALGRVALVLRDIMTVSEAPADYLEANRERILKGLDIKDI